MIDLFDTLGTSLHFDTIQFKDRLRNHFHASNIDIGEPGNWEYEGKWYFNKTDLYIAILAYKSAEQFGITDVAALLAVLSGQSFISTRGKFTGATKGTSYASKYLSRLPYKSKVGLPMLTGYPKIIGGSGLRVTYTKILGRFLGRAIPFIGWGILAYDVSIILYETQLELELIIENED